MRREQSSQHIVVGFAAIVVAAALAVGCGGAAPAAEAPVQSDAPTPSRSGSGMAMESEIGALDEGEVQQAFERASRQLSRCFTKGVQRIPYMGGEIRFSVRVAQDGSARWVYVKDSTLGDRDTETCMLAALKSTQWPKPVGGEGLAENSFTFEHSSDERPPVDWTPEQLGEPFKKARGALASCRRDAGGPLKATMYIDTDGKALAVGVSSADERGEQAATCVVETLRELTFPSPGSYASKVSVSID